MISRDAMEKMSEDDLREKIVIPLFRAMGFRDVFSYHGGSGEQGKDIVMWKPEPIQERLNYGVVLKATNITGKATGKSSASEVAFQIQQCLGRPYQDPTTIEERSVHTCYVVCSRKIKKEALNSITSSLEKSNLAGRVQFIGGDKLWELFENFCGDAVVVEKLVAAREVLENVSAHHRITASIGKAGVVLSTEPKYPGAEKAEPVEFKMTLEFSDTVHGKKALEDFQEHFKTGAPFSISNPTIKSFSAPEFLAPFLNGQIAELGFGPRQVRKAIPLNVIVMPAGNPHIELTGLEFRITQVGEEQLTLENTHRETEPQFKITLGFPARTLSITYHGNVSNQNVVRQLESVRICAAFATGCKVRLVNSENGLTLAEGELQVGEGEAPSERTVAFMERLAFIQARTRTPLSMPARDISEEEAAFVYNAADRLAGIEFQTMEASLDVTLTREWAQKIVDDQSLLRGQPLTVTQDESWRILDTEVRVGKSHATIRNLVLAPGTIERLKCELVESDAEGFDARFEVGLEPARITFSYPDCFDAIRAF